MNTFLWTIVVLGLIEVGGAMAYWTMGRVPERTLGGVLISGAFWAGIAAWAFSLIGA